MSISKTLQIFTEIKYDRYHCFPLICWFKACVFLFQADKFNIYVTYCKNKPDSSQLILEHAGSFFDVSTHTFSKSSVW